jgi:hypothetical protein
MITYFHFSLNLFSNGTWNVVEKNDNLSVNFAPAAAKLIVDSHFTDLGPSFCVLQGDTTRFEFGAV